MYGEYAAPTCGGIPNSQVSISLWGQTPSFIWSARGAREMHITTFQGANKIFDHKYFKLQFVATQHFVSNIKHRSHNHKASFFTAWRSLHCIACTYVHMCCVLLPLVPTPLREPCVGTFVTWTHELSYTPSLHTLLWVGLFLLKQWRWGTKVTTHQIRSIWLGKDAALSRSITKSNSWLPYSTDIYFNAILYLWLSVSWQILKVTQTKNITAFWYYHLDWSSCC